MKLNKEKKYTLLWLFFFAVNIIIIAFIAYREFHGKEHSPALTLGENGILFLLCGLLCLLIIFVTETGVYVREISPRHPDQFSFRICNSHRQTILVM